MPGDDRHFGTRLLRLDVTMEIVMNARIALLTLVAALSLGLAAPSALAAPQPAASTARTVVYKLKVNGLACPYCAYGIEKTFEKTGKTANIEVQIAAGFVVLHMRPGRTFTPKRLKQLVANAGFTLKGVQEASGSNSPPRK